MNQRIRELAEQCYEYSSTQIDVEKFAELIIAKCIEEAGEPADGLIKGNTWHDGVRASVWSIKQYFGVK